AERRGQTCRVIVREGSRGLVTSCTCPQHVDHGETCRHIVAALVAWISRRDGGAGAQTPPSPREESEGSPTEAIHSLRSLIRLVRENSGSTEPGPRERADPGAVLAALLPRDVPIRVTVDRGGHTHGLVVAFLRDDEARLVVPEEC